MADGDYERGRGREIDEIAAELKRLAAARKKAAATISNGEKTRESRATSASRS